MIYTLLEVIQEITSIWFDEDEAASLDETEIYEMAHHIPEGEIICAMKLETNPMALAALVAIAAVCWHEAAVPQIYHLHWKSHRDEWLNTITDWGLSVLDGERYHWVHLWEQLCRSAWLFIQPYEPEQLSLW